MVDEEEKVFTINLRPVWSVPRTQRVPRAIKEVRSFVLRHLKADEETIWIDPRLNEVLWKQGREKPPRRIQVRVISITEPEELIQVSPLEPERALEKEEELAEEAVPEPEAEEAKEEGAVGETLEIPSEGGGEAPEAEAAKESREPSKAKGKARAKAVPAKASPPRAKGKPRSKKPTKTTRTKASRKKGGKGG